MAEVLVCLNEVVKSVSSRLMPTELDDIVRFLLSQHVETVYIGATAKAAGDPAKGTDASTTAGAKADSEAHSPSSALPLQTIEIPDGLTAWHDFIPLGIATDSVVWGHLGDGGAALHTFFSGRGFDKVFSVNLTPTNGAALAGSSGVLDNSETQAGGTSASLRSIQASRFACVDAIREWCETIEDESRRGELGLVARGPADQFPFFNSNGKRPREDADNQRTESLDTFTTRHLLVIVRCCTDNRATFSTSSASGRAQHRARRKANDNSSVEAARRHRYGSDQLQLFLHDFATLATFHNIRLRRRCWRIHFALFLLPEDQLYGGTLLEQRLEEEVHHLYHIKLFTQQDDYNVDDGESHDGSASSCKPNKPLATMMRIHRLVSLWEPSLLHASPCADGAVATSTMNPVGDGTAFRIEDLERHLLREGRFFFLRPHNLPLCCFLCEALRRFPLLVPSPVLRRWQRVWAVRHSLQDLVLSFHSTLMPFAFSGRWFAETSEDLSALSHHGDDGFESALLEVSAAKNKGEIRGRRRTAYVDILKDTTDILDGFLSASDTLSHGYRLDAAVIFMLLYAELIDPDSSELHVLRCQPIIEALEAIYDREERVCGLSIGSAKKVPPDEIPFIESKQKARYALKHYLPFSWPDRGAPAVAVEQLPNLRIPLTSTLSKSLLHSILSPELSMQEFVRVAAYEEDLLTAPNAPKPSHRCEGASDAVPSVSINNFYQGGIPDSVRVLYLLVAHAEHHEGEKAKYARIVDVQQVAQLSDEAAMLALKELELAGLIVINTQSQTVCSLLQ